MGFKSAVKHIFIETAMHARAQASNRLAKANRASRGPRGRAKERVKRTRGNPKESPKEPKARIRVKHRKNGLSGLENSKSETSSETPDNSRVHDGWNLEEWSDGWSFS